MILSLIHSFVNIFAGGRSEVRIYLFILYTILLGIIFFFSKHTFKTLKWKWFGLTLLLMYLYGLLLHIFYAFSFNLRLTDFFITGHNGEISSSVLWHTHLAKGVIGQIFSYFGKTQMPTLDAGGAYIGILPSPVFLFGTVLFTTLVIQTIFYFGGSFKLLLVDKTKRQKIFLFWGYTIITFSLLKTSIDGGIFNHSFGVGIIFIALFILRLKKKTIINYYFVIIFISMLLMLFSLCIDSFVYGAGLDIAYIAVLSLFYAVLLHGSEEKIRYQIFIPLLILFMTGWWVASARDRDIYNYSKILLPSGQQIYTYNENTNEVEASKIAQAESVAQHAEQLNKNVTYAPITVPGITCMPTAPYQEFLATIISLKPISQDSFINSHYLEIKNETSKPERNIWKTNITVFTNPCLPETLSVIDGLLRNNSINTYLLVNPLFYDSTNYQ
jgi:hypothetical protein